MQAGTSAGGDRGNGRKGVDKNLGEDARRKELNEKLAARNRVERKIDYFQRASETVFIHGRTFSIRGINNDNEIRAFIRQRMPQEMDQQLYEPDILEELQRIDLNRQEIQVLQQERAALTSRIKELTR